VVLSFWTAIAGFIVGPVVQPLIGVGVLALAGFIARTLHLTHDYSRAQAIAAIAKAVVAEVVLESQGAEWAKVLQRAIDQLAAALPTTNPTVIARVAKAALLEAGVKP